MSWFKKLFGSQSSSQSSSPSSSRSSQEEPKVYYSCNISTKQNENETETESEKQSENVTCSEFQEYDDTTQSTQDSCYNWSRVSQQFDVRGEKRELSNDEEEPWWESFKSQSTQKSDSSQMKLFSSQSSWEASDSQTEAIQDENKNNENEEKDENEQISFHLKLGKNKKFKFM